ncbi:hypothetical protein S40285_08071 [Stachybotrys chlorohalonatus IBT 40285]|uniref:Ysc84 actin-binding domain-containing protein n=1 Tax=Stachybotrys chlorohalonatus (strain IBT 40285) TaxID=1283841 RepID=A0A084Q8G5_STAC4|nr:hypothetical protein S40285_08071 [Stachybotrys chlorohalonata IBT 40285]
MDKVKAVLPSWDTTKTQSKKGFDKAYGLVDKLGPPINRLSNRVGSEAFWPTTLDKESDKAARILRSFCKEGYYVAEEDVKQPGQPEPNAPFPDSKQRVIMTIPQKVIENAVGLAIFTTMRTGLWFSGAGGSGVLVARQEDGTWSPPSGIMLHTAGLGFLVGVDIYDCVLVINNRKALESFTKVRATLGGEISAVAGPAGVGGIVENDGKWKEANKPVFTYLKSRGLYAGVQVDGTIVIERTDENARFYGEEIGVTDILAGKVRHQPPEIRRLMETLKAAEGRSDYDEKVVEELGTEPVPSDFDVEAPEHIFGVPEPDDPDPFGVGALKSQGMDVVEAGTRAKPSDQEFEYHPNPNSPIYLKLNRQSIEAKDVPSSHTSQDQRDATYSLYSPPTEENGAEETGQPKEQITTQPKQADAVVPSIRLEDNDEQESRSLEIQDEVQPKQHETTALQEANPARNGLGTTSSVGAFPESPDGSFADVQLGDDKMAGNSAKSSDAAGSAALHAGTAS